MDRIPADRTECGATEFFLLFGGRLKSEFKSVIDLIVSPEKGQAAVVPPIPESIQDAGIPPSIIEHLILKYLYFRGELVGRDIGALIGFPFSIIDETLEMFKRQHYVAVKKSLGMGNMSGMFALTEAGRNMTRELLENNQ